MNAFWEDGLKDDAEKIWDFVHYANEITKPKTGCNDMDEFQSHRFLEHFGETLTVIALRDKLRAIDIDMNKRMALVEYMVFWRTLAVRELCTRPQGSNKKEIDEAKAKLDEVQTSFDEVMKQLEEQKIAEKVIQILMICVRIRNSRRNVTLLKLLPRKPLPRRMKLRNLYVFFR